MRILFMCGGLEPGRDGVGDYTRQLATELRRRGHQIALAALTDPYVEPGEARDGLPDDGVPTIRVHSFRSDRNDRARVLAFADAFDADWISLQFVPWSFGSRGLVRWLAKSLAPIVRGAKIHVMAHELWLGRKSGFKLWALGVAQRSSMTSLLDALSPDLVTTTIDHYRLALEARGVRAEVLPLFGNVPILGPANQSVQQRPQDLRLMIFGTPPGGALLDTILDALRSYAIERPVAVSIAGSADDGRRALVDRVRDNLPRGSTVEDLGFISIAEASRLMLDSDVGLTRNEGYYLGKSGVLLAMVEHGMSVWAPAWDGSRLDLAYRAEMVHRDLATAAQARRAEPRSRLPDAADELLAMFAGR